MEALFKRIAEAFGSCLFLQGVVLGGSRATGTATETSDIDIGLYYQPDALDLQQLNEIARLLDDGHREQLICKVGEWGPWVNCGGWLTVDGYRVDLILRDVERVRQAIRETDAGSFSCHYQTGHPHAYLNVIYRGELASCRIPWAREDLIGLYQAARQYPEPLRDALASFFLFEADFSCGLAKSYGTNGDSYYLAGQLFRSVSALNQVLFAVNHAYCLNEKKAVLRAAKLALAPVDYAGRIDRIFSAGRDGARAAVEELEQLCREVRELAEETGSDS